MNKTMIFAISCSIALISGCGSASSSTRGSGDSGTTSGTVSGSYYEGAIVCFDKNGDGSCSGEETTITDTHGNFILNGSGNYPIVAEIPVGAKKHEVLDDNGVEINSTTKTVFAIPSTAISKAKLADGGKVVISAITTKLYTYVKDNPNANVDDAMEIVANSLGLEKDKLLEDFNDPNIDETTRLRLKEKADILLEKIKGKDSINEVKSAVENYVSTMKMPSKIEVIKDSQE